MYVILDSNQFVEAWRGRDGEWRRGEDVAITRRMRVGMASATSEQPDDYTNVTVHVYVFEGQYPMDVTPRFLPAVVFDDESPDRYIGDFSEYERAFVERMRRDAVLALRIAQGPPDWAIGQPGVTSLYERTLFRQEVWEADNDERARKRALRHAAQFS